MQLLTEIIIGFFSAYLALTNGIAERVEELFVHEDTTQEETTFSKLSSAYNSIPKILIENAAYQSGAVIDADSNTATATPLEALVNIYCTYTTDDYTRTTTGTGFFVDSDGVILTNAHVAQFLLLETLNGQTDCIVRTGNPAVATYEADLLYISPAWVQEHAALIATENPKGTGERDYALLYVTAGLNNKPMPRTFPALPLDTALLPIQALYSETIAAGYPAGTAFATGDGNAPLLPKQASTSIVELMTFGSNYADLMTIGGSLVGEQGASGGPVLNTQGDVIGIISTRGDDASYGAGSLRALTLSYIDRTIQEETGFTLQRNLGGNLPFRSQLFKETLVPFLSQMLQRELVQ